MRKEKVFILLSHSCNFIIHIQNKLKKKKVTKKLTMKRNKTLVYLVNWGAFMVYMIFLIIFFYIFKQIIALCSF
jgi:hypothetical protein